MFHNNSQGNVHLDHDGLFIGQRTLKDVHQYL
jgi:hypothetical protein